MSTIAGEGTNSDGREVTMTAQEREKTDAEMTGTTGKKERCSVSLKQDSGDKCLFNYYILSLLFPQINFPESGTGAGNAVAAESTGIMTGVEGRDSPRPDTT